MKDVAVKFIIVAVVALLLPIAVCTPIELNSDTVTLFIIGYIIYSIITVLLANPKYRYPIIGLPLIIVVIGVIRFALCFFPIEITRSKVIFYYIFVILALLLSALSNAATADNKDNLVKNIKSKRRQIRKRQYEEEDGGD